VKARFKTTIRNHPLEHAVHLTDVECPHPMEMIEQPVMQRNLGGRQTLVGAKRLNDASFHMSDSSCFIEPEVSHNLLCLPQKVLRDTHRVVVPSRKVRLQIMLDVMSGTKTLQEVNHPERVISPIRATGNLFEVVRPPDLVEVNVLMCSLDNGKAGLHVQGGLQ
jgi:hypothetical protein